MTETAPLHLPEGQRYACRQCGDGCHIFNEYPLDDASIGRMRDLAVEDLLPSELRARGYLMPGDRDPGRKVLRRRDHDHACVFRQPDMLCGIHAHHGMEAKPRVCQDFPYRFVDTPLGIHPGLSFACSAVLENHGPLVSDQGGELQALHQVSGAITVRADPVHLTDLHQISWPAWGIIQGGLKTILTHPGESVGRRLAAQAMFLDLFRNLVVELRRHHPAPARVGRGETPLPHPPDCGQQPDHEAAQAITRQFTSPEGLARLFALVDRPVPNPTTQASLLGLVCGFRRALDVDGARPGRLRAVSRLLFSWFSQALPFAPLRLPGIPDSLPRRGIAERSALPADAGIVDLLDRYFAHSLFRQDLLMARNVWIGQRWQLLHFSLVRVYAAAEAIQRGEGVPSLASFRAAVRNVEKYFVFHGGFQRLFDRYPMLGTLLDAAAHKPVYPVSMILDPYAKPKGG